MEPEPMSGRGYIAVVVILAVAFALIMAASIYGGRQVDRYNAEHETVDIHNGIE